LYSTKTHSYFYFGALLVSLYALNKVKPQIITDNYIESIEQSIKKLKQSGTNNEMDLTPTINFEPKKKVKFLKRVFKRKKKEL